MFFSSLPEVRHAAITGYLRQRAGALSRSTPGQGSIPMPRPMASRFLIAGICGWILWQPLKGNGQTVDALGATPTVAATALAGTGAESGLRPGYVGGSGAAWLQPVVDRAPAR